MQALTIPKLSSLPILALNFIGFELVWFALVTQGDQAAWLGLAFAAIHLAYFRKSKTEAKFVVAIAVFGIILDSILTITGIFQFNQSYAQNIAPLWLISLWFAFACTINHSLSFMRSSQIVQVIFAAIFAPFSYFVGYKFDAVSFGLPLPAVLLVLAVLWAAFLPFCFWFNQLLTERSHA